MCTKHTESTATEPKSRTVTDTRWNSETIKHCADPTGTQNVYTSERTREKERGGGEKKRKGVGGSERERRDAFYWITRGQNGQARQSNICQCRKTSTRNNRMGEETDAHKPEPYGTPLKQARHNIKCSTNN